jgi:hypothetical protein
MGSLRVKAPIETFDTGARGFNAYTGLVNQAEFHSVRTHGDAAVGVQCSKPVGRLVVHHGIHTEGASGPSLVKGVLVPLPAYGLSVLPGCEIDEVVIDGGLSTQGDAVTTFRNDGGWVRAMRVNGEITATGAGSDAIVLTGQAINPLTNLVVSAGAGAAVRLDGAAVTALSGLVASGTDGDIVVDADSTVGTPAQSAERLGKADGNQLTVSGAGELTVQPLPYAAYPH